MPRFGSAGNPQAFYDAGYQSSVQMPAWLASQNLGAYEYQCGRGVNIGFLQARLIGEAAAANDVVLSIHAPYYINLASTDSEKQSKTIGYILSSLQVAREMGATRVVLHPGSAMMAPSRSTALSLAIDLLKKAISLADEQQLLYKCQLCPEVMGKNNQLGDLEEVITLCRQDDRLVPCVDFGHLNARTQGGLKTKADYQAACDLIANALGYERLKHLHIHYSRIEFSLGGEKKHHRLEDRQYGPDFYPLAQVIAGNFLEPVIICESNGTQASDAAQMQEIYQAILSP